MRLLECCSGRFCSTGEQARSRTGLHQCLEELYSAMASHKGPSSELKQQFATKEGVYRLMTLSEYSRPNKMPYSVQQCHPVRVSFVTVKEPGGCNDRIAFNVGRDLYFYIYKGVRKVSL